MNGSPPIALAVALTAATACDTTVGPTALPAASADAVGATAARLVLVSGNNQPGKAGEQLGDPFVVRVTDARGNGLSDITVTFRVASGAGVIGGPCGSGSPTVRSSRTGTGGTASMTFLPTMLGTSTIVASSAGVLDPVTFAIDATVLVVDFWFGFWNVGFVGPCTSSSHVTVPVGTPVEWRIPVEDDRYPVSYTVTSTATPPGAGGFDSGLLTSKERFRFVPRAAGTWEYRDKVSGLAATLTAR